MPSRKLSTAASPATQRMSHQEALSILMDLWSCKQVDAARAGTEMEKARG